MTEAKGGLNSVLDRAVATAVEGQLQGTSQSAGWDARDDAASLAPRYASMPPDKLGSLLQVSRDLMRTQSLDALLTLIMHSVTQVMDAERSTLFLLDPVSDELFAKVAQGTGDDVIRFPKDQGIAGHVATSSERLIIDDAYQDARFNPDFDRKTGFRTRAIACIPMHGKQGQVLGVMQVLNKLGEPAVFSTEDVELLEAFSAIAAISIENAYAFETIRRTKEAFQRFVPPRYLHRIARDGLSSIALGHPQPMQACIMFSDLRNFTTLSEQLPPRVLFSMLNDSLGGASEVIAEHGGYVDKFIGDAVMAVFEDEPHLASVRAAFAMIVALDDFNAHQRERELPELGMGIGVHYGRAMLGTVGTESRMESALIGDTVNVASRLESLTKAHSVPLIVSEPVYAGLPEAYAAHFSPIGEVTVKGRVQSLSVFALQTDTEALRQLVTL